MWFLAPPRAWTRLPCRLARLVDVLRDRGGADEADRLRRRGWSSSASTAILSPCRTLKTPSGRPASCQSAAIQMAAHGSFSLGLRTTALPAAIAIGKNHIGTIAGKLNGLMMPTTPSGTRLEWTSTPVEASSRVAALEQVGDAARELDDLEAAGDLAQRVGVHLAVLGGDDRGELVLAAVEQLAEGEEDLGTPGQRRGAPARGARAAAGDDAGGVGLARPARPGR